MFNPSASEFASMKKLGFTSVKIKTFSFSKVVGKSIKVFQHMRIKLQPCEILFAFLWGIWRNTHWPAFSFQWNIYFTIFLSCKLARVREWIQVCFIKSQQFTNPICNPQSKSNRNKVRSTANRYIREEACTSTVPLTQPSRLLGIWVHGTGCLCSWGCDNFRNVKLGL